MQIGAHISKSAQITVESILDTAATLEARVSERKGLLESLGLSREAKQGIIDEVQSQFTESDNAQVEKVKAWLLQKVREAAQGALDDWKPVNKIAAGLKKLRENHIPALEAFLVKKRDAVAARASAPASGD